MARPRKLSDDEMLKIVDSFYESNGNPNMLKCSLLEKHAISLGIEVKAYDFRRNTAVRKRMAELKDLSPLLSNSGATAYKSLDVDALMNQNRTKPMLRNALLELDASWHKIYERAAEMLQENDVLKADNKKTTLEIETLSVENSKLSVQITQLNKVNKDLVLENRYLKKMLKQYLYPAVANEILMKENVLEQADTEVSQMAMEKMTDSAVPSTFSSSVAADRYILSREESLLERMQKQIKEGQSDAP